MLFNVLIFCHFFQIYIYTIFTFATEYICVSSFTSFVTKSRTFVTRRAVYTVTTAVIDTVITIGPVITLCNN